MTHIIVLAGGKGIRMQCDHPKVLTEVKGKTLVEYLLENIRPACARPTVVVGYKGEEVVARLGAGKYDYVWQREPQGTGHAVKCAREYLKGKNFNNIVVLYGDHPLATADTVKKLVAARERSRAAIAMGIVTLPDFEGERRVFERFGRVVRNGRKEVARIVEYKDATDEEKKIKEVNPSYFCFEARWLWGNLDSIKNENAAGEYYLTDLQEIAFRQRKKIVGVDIAPVEGMGANTPEELAIVSKFL